LIDLGVSTASVNVVLPRSVCLPVRLNNATPSSAVLDVVQATLLKRYDIMDTTGSNLPPLFLPANVQLTNLSAGLSTSIPDLVVEPLPPKQLMLPGSQGRGPSVPALRWWATCSLACGMAAVAFITLKRRSDRRRLKSVASLLPSDEARAGRR